MKQPQYSPLTNAEIVCVIFAGTNGYLDKIAGLRCRPVRAGLLNHLRRQEVGPSRLDHQRRSQDQG
jgi:F-type H+-transporting ATPase subunit alpha